MEKIELFLIYRFTRDNAVPSSVRPASALSAYAPADSTCGDLSGVLTMPLLRMRQQRGIY